MSDPTNLPPSVAELRSTLLRFLSKCGESTSALEEMCRRAADPAPVADEAAIEKWNLGLVWDTNQLVYRLSHGDKETALRLMRAAPRNDDKLRKLHRLVQECGARWCGAVGRANGEDTRDASARFETFEFVAKEIDKILAESPAGDAGESETVRRLRQDVSDLMKGQCALIAERDDARARLQAAIRDRQDAEALQSKLAADLAAAQKERDEASKIAMTANAEAVRYMRERDEAQADAASKAIDLRHARDDIAAAKAESARAVVEELEDLKTRLGNVDNCVSWKSSEAMNAQHQERVRTYHQIDRRIAKLRAAQPQSTTAAPATEPVCTTCDDTHTMYLEDRSVPCTHCPTPCEKCRAGAYCKSTPCECRCHTQPATVRQGDEVLREFLARDDSCGGPTLDEEVMREVCRRLLEGKP